MTKTKVHKSSDVFDLDSISEFKKEIEKEFATREGINRMIHAKSEART
jgi:hypothetical protein